jgi:hypothetical protein
MAKSKAQKELETTAFHEAGHAVIATLNGVPFASVTIIPDPAPVSGRGRGYLGRIIYQLPDYALPYRPAKQQKRARQYFAHNICMTLAGPLAETLHTRCWEQPRCEEGYDELGAFEAALLADDRHSSAYLWHWINRLRFQTLELLQNPDVWAAVAAVARELIERKTLESAEVAFLVQRCGCHKPTSGGLAS